MTELDHLQYRHEGEVEAVFKTGDFGRDQTAATVTEEGAEITETCHETMEIVEEIMRKHKYVIIVPRDIPQEEQIVQLWEDNVMHVRGIIISVEVQCATDLVEEYQK